MRKREKEKEESNERKKNGDRRDQANSLCHQSRIKSYTVGNFLLATRGSERCGKVCIGVLPADRLARVLVSSFFLSYCSTPSIRFPSRSPRFLYRSLFVREVHSLDKTQHAKLVSSALGSRLIALPRFEFRFVLCFARSLSTRILHSLFEDIGDQPSPEERKESGGGGSSNFNGSSRDQDASTTVSKRFWTGSVDFHDRWNFMA